MTTVDGLKENLQRSLSSIRELYEDYEEDELEALTDTGADFRDPCQLELFWMDSPIEYQLLVKTNDNNRDDGRIIINGPYKSHEFIDEVDAVLEKPRWQQLIEVEHDPLFDVYIPDDEEVIKRRDKMTGSIKGLVNSAKLNLFNEMDPGVRGSSTFPDSTTCFYIKGSFEDVDFVKQMEGRIDFEINGSSHFKGKDESNEEDPEAEELAENENTDKQEGFTVDQDTNAFGTYFYEPVWVGGKPDTEFKSEVLDETSSDFPIAVKGEIEATNVLVRKDGFVSVSEEEKARALKILNSLFGASLFLDEQFHSATHHDLVPVVIEEDDIKNEKGNPSIPRLVASPDHTPEISLPIPFLQDIPIINREIIDKDLVNKMIDLANNICENDDLREKVNFALQAYTHHANGEYSQSYLLSWIAIEQHIGQLLNQHLQEVENVNRDRRDKITDSPNWTSTHKIEVLEISSAIDNDEYTKANKMRKKRNKIVHEMEIAEEEESKEILNFTLSLLYDNIPNSNEDPYPFKI